MARAGWKELHDEELYSCIHCQKLALKNQGILGVALMEENRSACEVSVGQAEGTG